MTGKKILIIDDEAGIRKYLSMALTSAQYLVEEAESGGLGLLKLNEARPDLVILDLGLPDIPGKDVLNFIRKQSQVPILILTAHSSEEEKVALLDFGADDYLTKPFGINELLARLRVMLRHSSPSVHHKEVFTSGRLKIDFASHVVWVDGKAIKFTKTEYELLSYLAQQPGRLVTQKQLLTSIWGPHSLDSTHYLRIYVTQLRKKIEVDPSSPQLLITEPGVGYRLMVME